MAATIEQVNMTEGALLPKIIRFSLPLAATGVLQLLFNAADVIVVGKFAGATALAAVGATTALVASAGKRAHRASPSASTFLSPAILAAGNMTACARACIRCSR